jgi:protein SCO1
MIRLFRFQATSCGRRVLSAALAAWITMIPQGAPLAAEGPGSELDRIAEAAQKYFTDTELLDQDGKPRRLYADLMAGKTVILHCFYSTCTSSCPTVARTLQKIQEGLGPRLGVQVHILSLTVDPERDTPAKLKEHANDLKAAPGWYFLTGSKENTAVILRKLGFYSENKVAHPTILVIGNVRTGLWTKTFSLAKPEEIMQIVEGVLQDKGASR